MKISEEAYNDFVIDYYTTVPQHLRFGQAFFNRFLKHDEEVGNIFYETNKEKVVKIIFENYIDK